MYNPLVKIKHSDGDVSYVRALSIKKIYDWEARKTVYYGEKEELMKVSNISEIILRLNEVEDLNYRIL